MNAKIDNLLELEYLGNFQYISQTFLKWSKIKETPELKKCIESLIDINFYVNRLEMDRKGYNMALSDYRSQRNRLVERSRKSEEERDKLQKEVEELKEQLKLFVK